jgi:hypothetical protein
LFLVLLLIPTLRTLGTQSRKVIVPRSEIAAPLRYQSGASAAPRRQGGSAPQTDYLHRRSFIASVTMKNRTGIFGTGTRAAQVGIGTLAVGAVLGIGATITPPTAVADVPAGRASAAVPAGFTERFYVPSVENGVLVDPDGDCSSPIPLPSEFDGPCKAHDLGYDLLRFGGASESTATARQELDTQLGERMNESCSARSGIRSRTSCQVMAEIATTAVRFNSWRQHYGTPEPEPALPYLLAIGIGGVIAAIGASAMSITAPLRLRGVQA